METPFPLQDDFTFEKLRFRHNEKLSRDIFDRMDGGKKIYPQEGLEEFSDVIETIKEATDFFAEAFSYVMKKRGGYAAEEDAERALYNSKVFHKPIRITGDKHPF